MIITVAQAAAIISSGFDSMHLNMHGTLIPSSAILSSRLSMRKPVSSRYSEEHDIWCTAGCGYFVELQAHTCEPPLTGDEMSWVACRASFWRRWQHFLYLVVMHWVLIVHHPLRHICSSVLISHPVLEWILCHKSAWACVDASPWRISRTVAPKPVSLYDLGMWRRSYLIIRLLQTTIRDTSTCYGKISVARWCVYTCTVHSYLVCWLLLAFYCQRQLGGSLTMIWFSFDLIMPRFVPRNDDWITMLRWIWLVVFLAMWPHVMVCWLFPWCSRSPRATRVCQDEFLFAFAMSDPRVSQYCPRMRRMSSALSPWKKQRTQEG